MFYDVLKSSTTRALASTSTASFVSSPLAGARWMLKPQPTNSVCFLPDQRTNFCDGGASRLSRTCWRPVAVTMVVTQTSDSSQGKRAKRQKRSPYLRRSGMNSPMVLSPELQAFCGADMLPKRDIIAMVSQYVKDNDLRVEGNRRKFYCDETLKRVLQTEGTFTFLELNKLITPLVKTPSQMGPEYQRRSDEMFKSYLKERGLYPSSLTPTVERRRSTAAAVQRRFREAGEGMFREVYLHPSLSTVCGGVEKLARPDIVKAVWVYIKAKNLQDESNRRMIRINDELRLALGDPRGDTIDSFHLGRYLFKLCGPQPYTES